MDPRTILVIEDNELNLKLVRTLLQRGGFQILEAGDAETGLALARSGRPDLILIDIQLPGMDGLTATGLLKKDPELNPIPVVALTSYAMEGDVGRAKEAGCNGYLTKPIDTRSFLNTVRKFIREGASLSPGVPDPPPYKQKILIVDDEPLNVKLLQAHFSPLKYETFPAYNGPEALTRAFQDGPDLILLDVMMPEMDGYEVTRRLKADPQTREVPVILVTALDGRPEKRKGLEAGADEFLNKPVRKPELLARVQSLILFKRLREQCAARHQVETLFPNPVGEYGQWRGHPSPPRVLIVEDDPHDAKLLQHCLGEMDLAVEVAANGEEALSRLERKDIDLVLLDALLPGVDGFKLCGRLKNGEETRQIQILLITCLADFESKARALEIGADDFLVKPIDPYELKLRVDTLLRKKKCLDRLQQTEEINFYKGVTDPITGLYNRAYLQDFLSFEIRRSLRQKYPLALLMCAVDDFAKIATSHGPGGEERILRELGHSLKENFREIDLPVYCGKEVFAVVLPYTDGPGAVKGAERVRKAAQSRPFSLDPARPSLQVNLRMGICVYSSPEWGVKEFIQKAAEALYRARKEGQACFLLEGAGKTED